MHQHLHDKVAIITGAGTGIGEAIAHKFAKEGAKVVVNGLPTDPVKDVVDSIQKHGGKAIGFLGDVSDEKAAEDCVRTAVSEWGRLDILINNAGVFVAVGETQDYALEDFDYTLRMNLRSAFLMTKYALPYLQKTRGNVICAGSESGIVGLTKNTPYGGTKGFLHAFMRGVAVEQAHYGVRANCICPGAVDTAWTHKEQGPMDAQTETMTLQATPLGRRATVEEIANVYAFLASDEASYVTGALWTVDGGITIGKGPVGDLVPPKLKKEPDVDLDVKHTHEGLKNKEYHTVK